MQGDQPPGSGSPDSALTRCIGIDRESFAASHWGCRPLLSPSAGPYEDVLSLDDVDELLSRRGLRTPFLRMAKDGTVLPPGRYTRGGGAGAEIADQIDADRVLGLFADGATLVLQGVHRTWPPVADLVARLAAELGHPVQANAYVTPAQSRGFSAHYDVHDVFVLQLAGRKRWMVHEPVHPAPLRSQPWEQHRAAVEARAAEEPHIDVCLAPGDALYLPRGWLHAAQALGGVSAHLTLGIHTITRYALLEALTAAAADDEELRTSLPLGLGDDPQQLEHDLAAVVGALSRRLAAATAADVTPAVRAAVLRGTRPPSLAPLAQAAAAAATTRGDRVRWRPLLWAEVVRGDPVVLRLPDRSLRLPSATTPALELLLHGEPVLVGDLPLPDPDDGVVLVRRLLREGVLIPATDGG